MEQSRSANRKSNTLRHLRARRKKSQRNVLKKLQENIRRLEEIIEGQENMPEIVKRQLRKRIESLKAKLNGLEQTKAFSS